jgi:formylmethanofuran dehydrogenase subunit C
MLTYKLGETDENEIRRCFQETRESATAINDEAVAMTIEAHGESSALCGLSGFGGITVNGSLGKHCLFGHEDLNVTVRSDVGNACGCAIESGEILVEGNCGDGLGAFGRGGFIATYGSAGLRCGVGLDGSDLFVRQSVGDYAAMNMRSGTLVIGRSAGEHLGLGMTGGIIFLRRSAASLAPDIVETKMKESERVRLGLLVAKAGIRTDAKEFRTYKARPL